MKNDVRPLLSEKDVVEASDVCIFCSCSSFNNVWVLQENPKVYLRMCNECSCVSASSLPSASFSEIYYSGGYVAYRKHFEAMERISSDANYHRLAMYLSGKLGNLIGCKKVRVLDFGGGAGGLSIPLLSSLKDRGVIDEAELKVVDVSSSCDKFSANGISVECLNSMESLAGNFDIVLASAVLEHLENPALALDDLMSRTRDDGILYIKTPYMLPLAKLLLLFGVKVDLLYPAHLYDLGQRFWENFAQKKASPLGFRLIKSQPSCVETAFNEAPLRTILAWLFKAPWFLFRGYYKWVGGWEIYLKKDAP